MPFRLRSRQRPMLDDIDLRFSNYRLRLPVSYEMCSKKRSNVIQMPNDISNVNRTSTAHAQTPTGWRQRPTLNDFDNGLLTEEKLYVALLFVFPTAARSLPTDQ